MLVLLESMLPSVSAVGRWYPLTPTLKGLLRRGLAMQLDGPDERYRRTPLGDSKIAKHINLEPMQREVMRALVEHPDGLLLRGRHQYLADGLVKRGLATRLPTGTPLNGAVYALTEEGTRVASEQEQTS